MAKKVMVLTGSPRKNGNTNTVADWFVEGAKEAGAIVDTVDVAQLKSKFNGCISCMGCQKSDKYECVVEDGIKPVLARIPEMDVVVFATPVYFFGPSAQIKRLIDRMYSLIKIDPAKGSYSNNLGKVKFAVIATAGGDINPGLSLVEQTFKAITGFVGIGMESLLVPFASPFSDDLKADTALREMAVNFGRKLSA